MRVSGAVLGVRGDACLPDADTLASEHTISTNKAVRYPLGYRLKSRWAIFACRDEPQ